MALIKCKECGTEVSSEAESCPKCAFPIKAATDKESKIDRINKALLNARVLRQYICVKCGHIGEREEVNPMNGCLFFFLLLILVIPAIIYLIWSNGAKYFVCPKCKNKELIPVNSDNGRKLALAADPEILENIANKKTL